MFCWSCGHENLDNQKYCGECGKSLYKPEKVVSDITASKNFSRAEEKTAQREGRSSVASEAKPVAKPPIAPSIVPAGTMLTPPSPSINPLVEEPRVVHEKLVPEKPTIESVAPSSNAVVPPVPIRDHVPNRINGPSFLGLSDEGASRDYESSYLLDEEYQEENSSPWRGYVLLAVLVIVSLLVIRNWQDVRRISGDYSQRLGLSDAPKRPAGPERVTASNDASKITPDAAPEEGKTSVPAEDKSAANGATKPETSAKPQNNAKQDDATAQQTAKLEKPQSDKETDKADKSAAGDGENNSPEKAAKSAAAAYPAKAAVDNSQLDEAQKYLQGKGVAQDCNRGVNLLQSAAKQANARARIQMAALYASGHCVTQDLPQAYNWFARAQELEPRNRLIERNLDSLWAQMTDEQRRKVLK